MNQLSWYDASEEVKELLILATDNWENSSLAEQYICLLYTSPSPRDQ